MSENFCNSQSARFLTIAHSTDFHMDKFTPQVILIIMNFAWKMQNVACGYALLDLHQNAQYGILLRVRVSLGPVN
jgi:hypothetical protein